VDGTHARTVVSDADGRVICERCVIADRPRSRLRGLMGRRALDGGEGMILRPAGSIHTCFMRFPIDAVFLGADGEVLRVRPNLAPWRAAGARGARAVLELAAGEGERRGVAVGQRLAVRDDGAGDSHAQSRSAAREDLPDARRASPRSPGLGAISSTQRALTLGIAFAVAAAALAHFGLGARGAIAAAFVGVLVVLAAADLAHRIIPNRIVLPAAGLILAAQIVFFPDRALEWVGVGAAAFMALLIPALIRPGTLGMGDVKLALLLGVGLGQEIVVALLLCSLAVFPVALWILIRGGWSARKRAMPFGPFLALGGVLATFVGPSL
jgi:uncharacterized membrane protein (UPF0127 family)/Flp pilus assembly protein protease CpaA